MLSPKDFDEFIDRLQELQVSVEEAKNLDIIPLSFFSSTMDSLNRMKMIVHEIERVQFELMQAHLEKMKNEMDSEELIIQPLLEIEVQKEDVLLIQEDIISEESEPQESFESNHLVEEGKSLLADTITKKIFSDLKKSLSLNDRFMLQRDLFRGNSEQMNRTLDELNQCDNLKDAVTLLDSNCSVNWESEAGSFLRELLEKRFI